MGGGNVQTPHGQNHTNGHLLSQWHLQPSQPGYGHQHGSEVGENAQPGVGKVEHVAVHAFSVCNRQIPGLCHGRAGKDIGQHTADVVSNRDEDDGPDGDVKGATGEDAQVEDEDGDFGEPGGGAVEDGSEHV